MNDPLPNSRGILWIFLGVFAIGLAFVAWHGKREVDPNPQEITRTPPDFPIPQYSESRYHNVGPEAQYIGSAACGKCHAANQQSYLLTPHSRAFSDVIPDNEPADGAFNHAASGRNYRIYRKDGRLHHEEITLTAEGKEITHLDFPVRFLIGSGHFSRTYLIEVDGFLHESPITWYASKQKWDMSPGYDARQHWGFERAAEIRCLACHSGRVEEEGAVHRMTFHEKAIGCENCHGPGSLHRDFQSSERPHAGNDDLTIVHPRKASRSIEESICAACHESSLATIELRGRSGGEFRPGRPLSDYRIHYRFGGDNQQMSVVGHVEQLRLSACYQKSERLTCVSCHDPHNREVVKDKTAFYREKCQSCHNKLPCKLNAAERLKKESNNCVTCHMPRGDTDIPHIAFTHHRIGLHATKPPFPGNNVPELVATGDISRLSQLDRQRNLGLAYAEVYRNPQYSLFADTFRRRARDNLEAVYTAGLRDGEAMSQLAEIYTTTNDFTRAGELAKEVLALSDNSTSVRARSLLVLADAERQGGDLPSAISHLEEATRLRRSDDNWRLLGLSYLENGQTEKAIAALQQALTIRPYQPDTHSGLAESYRLLGNSFLSTEHRGKALWVMSHKQR
jgi:tetratricopeptide (TPR) repeat protein